MGVASIIGAQTPDGVPSGRMGSNLVALIAHLSGHYHPLILSIVSAAQRLRISRFLVFSILWAVYLISHERGSISAWVILAVSLQIVANGQAAHSGSLNP